MKVLRLTLSGHPRFADFSLDFTCRQRVGRGENVLALGTALRLNPAVGIAGINASGKTSVLKAVILGLQLLNQKLSVSQELYSLFLDMQEKDELTYTTVVEHDGSLYQLVSVIRINPDPDSTAEYPVIIMDEQLYKKPLKSAKTKKDLFQFCEDHLVLQRSDVAPDLDMDTSIIRKHLGMGNRSFFMRGTLFTTNHNFLLPSSQVHKEYPLSLIRFLDASIEKVTCEMHNNSPVYTVKFYGQKEIRTEDFYSLEQVLSSGTIKGLSLFENARFIWSKGGILIVDELENHFNHAIVNKLIQLFQDPAINKAGGVLLFTTHWSEALDLLPRNDSIYITSNPGRIHLDRLSSLLSRNDVSKKSAYDSALIKGTAPSYQAWMDFKTFLLQDGNSHA